MLRKLSSERNCRKQFETLNEEKEALLVKGEPEVGIENLQYFILSIF